MTKEKIIMGSDHAGFDLKAEIVEYLSSLGYKIKDMGVYSKESADYPVIAKEAAKRVSGGEFTRGILICGTGIGMCIAANKIKGIRAAVCTEALSARLSREHNDTNILCLGARITGASLAKDICITWLETGFQREERHLKRIRLIEEN